VSVGSGQVGFVVGKMALGQVFYRALRFSPTNIITLWLSILIYHLGNEQYTCQKPHFGDIVSPHRHEQPQTTTNIFVVPGILFLTCLT
jgi:branched-subunit amino acid transport protein